MAKKGGDIKDHPLLKMLEKRIRYSEKMQKHEETKDIWREYFASDIKIGKNNRRAIHNYILDQTWYKPRDIVRMFTLIKKDYGSRSLADTEVFDGIRAKYSQESWEEFEEVLKAAYSDNHISAIKTILHGLDIPFLLQDFREKINRETSNSNNFKELIKNMKEPALVLQDLYEIGVIGNYEGAPRFIFTGDTEINTTKKMTIHYPLVRFFNAVIKNNKHKHNYR